MNIIFPVNNIKTTKLTATKATPAASPEVLSRLRTGRHTVSITALDADIYVGGTDVTSATGVPVKAGTSLAIPVDSNSTTPVYVIGGSCVIAEYF